ncbi:hypothetical protein [Pseudoalteromonas sp.]
MAIHNAEVISPITSVGSLSSTKEIIDVNTIAAKKSRITAISSGE